METTTYTLPTHWAVVFFNDDWSGIDEEEEERILNFIAGENFPDPIGIVGDDAEHGPESSFVTYHDARPYGVLACDCFDYIVPA